MRLRLREYFRQILRSDSVFGPLALIFLLGSAAYATTLSVPLQYDDVMTLRKQLSDPFSIGGTRWVVDWTFSLNRLVHGESVAGYHVVNLMLHLASAAVLFLLVRSILDAVSAAAYHSPSGKHDHFLHQFVPLATACLFVCHPVQTQAVTYIAQRYTVLASFCYLSSLLLYVRARLAGSTARAWILWAAAAAAALLALQSKEIAATLPVMAVVLEVLLFKGGLLKRPVFVVPVLLLLLIIPLQLLLRQDLSAASGLAGALQQASSEVQGLSRGDYFLTQLRVIVTYLRLLILPVGQNLDYDYPIQQSLLAVPVLASMTLHLALAAAGGFMLLRSGRLQRDGRHPQALALLLGGLGILWFYLALSVESGIIPIRDVIYEHRLYLPSAGLFMGAAGLVTLWTHGPVRRLAVCGLTVCCCLVLAGATIARNQVWNSQLGLWMDVLEKSPNKFRGHYLVGTYLAQQARFDKAIPHLVRSIELNPAGNDSWIMLNSAVQGVGKFAGRCNDGLKYQQTVFLIDPRFQIPWQAVSHNNLGLAYEFMGNLRAAQVNFEKAAIIDPKLDLAWLNQALNAAARGDRSRLSSALGRLADLNPDLAQAALRHLNAGHPGSVPTPARETRP